MFNFIFGFLIAVAVSIGAPDEFAAVSKFVRSLPGKALAKYLSFRG